MKQLNWTTTSDQHEYMRMRKNQNISKSKSSKAENWFYTQYANLCGIKFSRQAQWGYRLFDFWFSEKGVAIEIDGPEHDQKYDAYRDAYNFLRSGVIVLRVRNFNDSDAITAIHHLTNECSWEDRRKALRVTAGFSKQTRRQFAENGDVSIAVSEIVNAGLYCSYLKTI